MKRKRTKTAFVTGAREVALVLANSTFAGAYERLRKRQRGIWAGQDLAGVFAMHASLAVSPREQSDNFREGVWLQGTRKSWKALTEFPERILKISREIRSLNSIFFRIPEGCENPILVGFERLPGILETYAGTVARRTADISHSRIGSPATQTQRLVELSGFTHRVTGKFHDREIADILNGAAIALSCESRVDFGPIHLTQARLRCPAFLKTLAADDRKKNLA